MRKSLFGIAAIGGIAFALLGCDNAEQTPAATIAAPLAATGSAGEIVFQRKCAICHDLGVKSIMGPGLRGVTQRYSDEWLSQWFADPQKVWEAGGDEVERLKARVGKIGKKTTSMKVRGLDATDIAHLIDYLHENDGV